MKKKAGKEKKESITLPPKKSLGQNFLWDKAILEKIIQAGQLISTDVVVEIGPGKGFLTKALLEKAGQVITIEKDEKLVEFLKEQAWFRAEKNRINLIGGDALEFKFDQFFAHEQIEKYKLIANIPYYITGQFLRAFQELERRPELAVLLVQKEVAERLCAPQGKKSLLSIAMDYYGFCRIITVVDKKYFFPVPKVDSAVVKIVFKKNKELAHPDKEKRKKFFRLVKSGFASRRKTLVNNLGIFWEKEKIFSALEEIGLNKQIRAQDLELAEWIELENFLSANSFCDTINKNIS